MVIDGSINLSLTGISMHSAPIGVLERLALSAQEIKEVYKRLLDIDDVQDALVLSTCNRTEIYTTTRQSKDNPAAVHGVLQQVAGATRVPGAEYLYEKSGRAGVEHLFRVACGLESQVLGEAQILGQLKAAWDGVGEYSSPSAWFEKLLQSAFRVAGQSRSQTEIGAGAVSVASAGAHLTSRIFSDFSSLRVLVVGAGETGRLVTEHLMNHRPKQLMIVNRSLERGQQLANRFGGEALGLSDLQNAMNRADIIASAVTAESPLISVEMVATALQQRGPRSLAILDLGLPRNVEPEAGHMVNVFVHDIENLGRVVDANLSRRRKEIPQVEALIHEEIARLVAWRRSLRAGPVIAALRSQVENYRQEEVERATKGLSEVEKQAVHRATRAVANKLLHGPMTTIRDYAKQAEEEAEALKVIQKIFSNLDLPSADEDE